MHSDTTIRPLSTRLFPKFKGASAYALSGIAARCDWIVLSDRSEPFVEDRLQTDVATVRTIFVSLRSHEAALRHLFDTVVPRLTAPFVLVTGSEDVTLPNQTDKRWPPLSEELRNKLVQLLDNPLLIRWFCENMDARIHSKQEALPLGLVFPDAEQDVELPVPDWGDIGQRYRRVLCAHRVRDGAQWETRKTVTELAKAHWRSFATILEEPVSEAAFEALIRSHAFVLCVEGGGLDPSPKAWQTLLHGAIPIVRRTPLTEAYDGFPIAIVDDWRGSALNADKLEYWFEKHFRSGRLMAQRDQVIEKLGLDYWWRRIRSCLPGT
ncbi:hypothetical protein [Maricaulis sp.]|uniref:hypothetical protein n=1 Tax=Maricaulis sp. TaxID=1486257 RepID=UPI002612337F|nr:hypothetical protein [Maricaulis sp.]